MAINETTGEVTYPVPSVVNPAVPTASTVYSAPNITQAATAPVKAPNLADPYGLYDQFMNSSDIQAARAQVAQGQGQINSVNQALRSTTTALENQNMGAMGTTGASVNLIGNQVGRARTLTANELAALGETQNANLANLSSLQADAQNRYGIAQQERAQIQDLIRSTSGKAGITYTDSYESALQKSAKYEKKLEKKAKKEAEEAAKKAEKKDLKKMAMSLGLSTSGSRREIERRISDSVKSDKEYERMMDAAKSKASITEATVDRSDKGVAGYIDEAYNSGISWNDIASTLQGKMKINTTSGSIADKYLRYKFGMADVKKNPLDKKK